MQSRLPLLTQRLARLATHYDVTGEWPARSLDHLTEAGAWSWVIPPTHGGAGLDAVSLLAGYEAVASGCLSSLLILTQRDAACEFVITARDPSLRDELLPCLAAHEIMITVGISQLTTSHQQGRPVLTARPDGDGLRLTGYMPWVTSAERCQFIVTGAVLPDGRQVLALTPTDASGVTIDPPMQLMALQSSRTSEVHCRDVLIEPRFVLRGPAERVLGSRSTVKPFVVATSGIGLAGAMIGLLREHAGRAGPPLAEYAEELEHRYLAVRERLYRHAAAADGPDAEVPKTEIRVAVNDLLVRLAVAVLTLAKGSGFLRQRAPQRLVREALFFLVWSAPEDVRARTLAGFLQTPPVQSRKMPLS